LKNCQQAIGLVDQINGCSVKKVSPFYMTEPVGTLPQEWYVNAVIRVDTTLDPYGLLMSLLSIESAMGRVRRQKWESRIIDLDILLFGDEIIQGDTLTIPHPMMHQRRFVMLPMAKLEAARMHPVLKKSMVDLAEDLGVEGQSVILLGDT